MKTQTPTRYTLKDANALVPLLQGIIVELRERSRAIRGLVGEWSQLSGMDGELPEDPQQRARAMEIRTRLSTQLRERRKALEELDSLGCYLVELDRQIRIPGPSGTMEDGYCWDLDAAEVERIPGVELQMES
ncbi:MAG: DUF2203 family protein [Planctomycetota bacterium]